MALEVKGAPVAQLVVRPVFIVFLFAIENLCVLAFCVYVSRGPRGQEDVDQGGTSEPSQCRVLWNHMVASCIHSQH